MANRYFTAAQSTVYINNLLAEQVFAVRYRTNSNTSPYYGYASRKFDAVLRGKYIVEGEILVYYNLQRYFWMFMNSSNILAANKLSSSSDIDKIIDGIVATGDEDTALRSILALIGNNASPGEIAYIQSKLNDKFKKLSEWGGSKGMDNTVVSIGAPRGSATLNPTPTYGPFTTVEENLNSPSSGGALIDPETGLIDMNGIGFVPGSESPYTQYNGQTVQEMVDNLSPAITDASGNPVETKQYAAIRQARRFDMGYTGVSLLNKANDVFAESLGYGEEDMTDVEMAGPFNIEVRTGRVGTESVKTRLISRLKDCFLTGKQQDFAMNDQILFTGYSFFAREEV